MDSSYITIISSFVSALIGGSIAGYFSLKATQKSHENEIKRQENNREQTIKNLLQAIHDEIEILWNAYMESFGVHLDALEDNKPLLFYYPVTQEYFTVYNGNSDKIGSIKNHDLRRLIVICYSKAKGLIDTFKMNNELVAKYEQSCTIYQETHKDTDKAMMDAYYVSLTEYASSIKKRHDEIKNEVYKLMQTLKKEFSEKS